MSTTIAKTLGGLLLPLLFCQCLLAHNGSVAHALSLGKVAVDGDLSDWPSHFKKYPILKRMSDEAPKSDADFSGFFQLGYRLEDRSLYIAFTIHDDDFVEDTTKDVRFNTQDGLEICIDGRHLPNGGSGVASFMYSKKLRNTNNSYYDPFARALSWDMIEVAMLQRGGTRYYEWKILLGDEMMEGRSLGFDFMVFDKDRDESFTFSGWGAGDTKFANPNSLGDIILMPAHAAPGSLTGNIAWDKPQKLKLPGQVNLRAANNPKLWVSVAVDSLGNYQAELPAGTYEPGFRNAYFLRGEKVYATAQAGGAKVSVVKDQTATAPLLVISSSPQPDLLPAKGILHNFNEASKPQVDAFIETYRKYFNIPGVSLALIKEGKVVYHQTYGVRNAMTGEKVEQTTLFEAASITKPVFAFAVERLAERGVIDLDRPLYLYLPYPDIAQDERYKLITAKHVLTHRTGFPNWRWMNEDGKLNILFTPGTAYGYSGEGFEYLKMVVEKITGKKVEQVLKEEVIEPVGLYHTFFSRNDSLKALVANGHYSGLPIYDELPGSPGMAYSMHTEALVFTRFMLYLLEQKGLTKASYEAMFSKQSEYDFGNSEKPKIPTYMGMSLEIRETPFGKSFGHGGNNGDFKCKFEVYKDIKMGYVLFTNSSTSDPLLDALRLFLVEGVETVQ